MTNSINLIAFGTFGNPNGFKQTFFVGNRYLATSIKPFDLNSNAIKLFINTKIYSIRKEYVNGFNTIAYSLYTYAREQNSDRSGTFIGSSILYTNKVAKEHITITQLNEFHNQLVNKNVINETISVNHSDKLSVVKPKDFDKVEFHLREIENINFRQNTNNILVVFCNINENNLKQFFEKSMDLLNTYDTIYFTDSSDIAEFVHQKGIFKLIQNVGEKKDFENEIKNTIEERRRKRELSIAEFEREIQRINNDKNRAIEEFKSEIFQYEKIHSENERMLNVSKDEIKKISQLYDDFLNKSKTLIFQLRNNNSNLDEVKQIYNSNIILFKNGLSELKKPNFITSIAKPKVKSNISSQHSNQINETNNTHIKKVSNHLEENDFKIDFYKVATLVLTIFLLFTWVYFLFFKKFDVFDKTQNQDQEETNVSQQETIHITTKKTELSALNPIPNYELNKNDYRNVAKRLTYNSPINDVVKIIFDKNPSEIKKNYINQMDIYSKNLINLNKECFEERDGINYFIKDTIIHIPTFKKK